MNRARQLPPAAHVAILRFSSAGDVLLTAPAVHALRLAWPEARLTFVTHAPFAPWVVNNRDIDHVLALPAGTTALQLRRALRERAPDVVLDLHGKLRGMFLRISLGAARSVAWEKRTLAETLAVRFGGARYHARCHIAARYHAAVEQLVGQPLPRQPLRYVVDAPSREAAVTLLRERGIRLDRPLVGMAPGALWETKRWPPDRFGALAAWAANQGLQVVLTGSPSERAMTKRVQMLAPHAVDLAGALDLALLAAIIDRCEAFVANDSGPMHMARALGVPTVALFGSTDPGQFDFSGHQLLFAGADCSPCSFHGLPQCPRGDLRCLNDLSVEQTRRALESSLSRGRAAYVMG